MRPKLFIATRSLLLISLIAVCSTQIPPIFLQSSVATLAASREPVRARHGIVASTNEIASKVGVDIMKRGGNAVDAAIAVAFALAVTHPAAGNLGGGGFMMIRLKDGRTTAIDYREMAPAAATRNIYLDQSGKVLEGEGGSIEGYRAAGVPGTVRGMELALKKYGAVVAVIWLAHPVLGMAAAGAAVAMLALALINDFVTRPPLLTPVFVARFVPHTRADLVAAQGFERTVPAEVHAFS